MWEIPPKGETLLNPQEPSKWGPKKRGALQNLSPIAPKGEKTPLSMCKRRDPRF